MKILGDCLTVLGESHVDGTLPEDLSLHVNSVLAHESHTTKTSSDTACTGTLAVVARVSGV